MEKQYAAIDLKSFYASVECRERGLDPMTTNLLVADAARTEKTICLAVSPSLKAYGIPGRARLFEAVQKVKEANALRQLKAPGRVLTGSSWDAAALAADPGLAIDYITAPPQMAKYMDYSARVYGVYLKYVAPEDIHVYSIDEVFLDVTPYLRVRGMTAREFVRMIIQDVLDTTGITATAGIGTNLYLCKVAMDIVAKKAPADAFGVRIAELTERSYRELLWDHEPLTDFWRVGRGYERRLHKVGLRTMGDIARCSRGAAGEYYNEDLLYKIFGVNAELLIDHAWGWESCTLADIKAYKPAVHSLSTGQVLHCPYNWEKTRLIVREMTDLLVLELVDKGLVTDQLTLTVGYDVENLTDPAIAKAYHGPVVTDHYGRKLPKHAHGTANLSCKCASTRLITGAVVDLFDRITDPGLLVRRITLAACRVEDRAEAGSGGEFTQLDLFTDPAEAAQQEAALERENRRQLAVLRMKRRYGKNAVIRAMNLQEGATAMARNRQIGGHRA